jgi:hypothetical protein
MVRLARRPSLWLSFFLRVAFVIVAGIAVNAALYFASRRQTFLMLTLVVLIAIAAVWELIRFAFQMRHRPPVVEIDRQPLAYGDTADLRVVEKHPHRLAEIGVRLIGECSTCVATDISEYREMKFARTRCYEEELLRLQPSGAVDRTVRVQLPKSPPADGMKWSIVVDSTLKHGDVIEHPYPLRVR